MGEPSVRPEDTASMVYLITKYDHGKKVDRKFADNMDDARRYMLASNARMADEASGNVHDLDEEIDLDANHWHIEIVVDVNFGGIDSDKPPVDTLVQLNKIPVGGLLRMYGQSRKYVLKRTKGTFDDETGSYIHCRVVKGGTDNPCGDSFMTIDRDAKVVSLDG